MSKWVDTTSYASGGRGIQVPTAWTLSVFGVRILVHRFVDEPRKWFLTVYGTLSMSRRRLSSLKEKNAKREALRVVKAEVMKLQEDILKAIDEVT